MATRNPNDPFDSVRDAFSDLGTSEKAAFVLEATFATLGQAISETGRRAASIVDDLDIDSWFRAPEPRDVGAPPPPPPAPTAPTRTPTAETPSKAASARKSAAEDSTAKKTDPKPSPPKTAGKPPPPPFDDPDVI